MVTLLIFALTPGEQLGSNMKSVIGQYSELVVNTGFSNFQWLSRLYGDRDSGIFAPSSNNSCSGLEMLEST